MHHRYFKAWRKSRHLAQKAVEAMTDMSNGTLSRIENGKAEYTNKHLEKMALAYNCQIHELFLDPAEVGKQLNEPYALLQKLSKADQDRAAAVLRAMFLDKIA